MNHSTWFQILLVQTPFVLLLNKCKVCTKYFCPFDSSYRSPKHGEAWFELQTKIATFFPQLSLFFDKMANKLRNIKSCTGFFLNNLKWTFITWSVRYTSDSQNFGNFSICSSKPDNFSLLKSLFWLNNGVINKCLCQYLQDLRNSELFSKFPLSDTTRSFLSWKTHSG